MHVFACHLRRTKQGPKRLRDVRRQALAGLRVGEGGISKQPETFDGVGQLLGVLEAIAFPVGGDPKTVTLRLRRYRDPTKAPGQIRQLVRAQATQGKVFGDRPNLRYGE